MAVRWSATRGTVAAVLVLVAGSLLATTGSLRSAPPARPASPARPTTVLVRGTSTTEAATAVGAVGGSITRRLELVDAVQAAVPDDAIASLRGEPGVIDVQAAGAIAFQADATPPREATGVYPSVIGAPEVWARGADGDHVGVAVIDTGIAPVADLAGRLVGGVDLSGGNDPFRDDFGHGTFVAGLIAGDGTSSNGQYKGVAPGADLVSVKIAGADGAADVSQVLAGIQWAVSFRHAYNIRVINLSLGTDSTAPYLHSLLNFAVERAWDAGIVVVAAASNKGPEPGSVSKPGDDPLVITTGALDDAGTVAPADDTIPSFSGVGPTHDGLVKPDIVAPGRSVVSLRVPGSTIDTQFPTGRVGTSYFKGSGTSFSAAVTSGAVALLLQARPGLAPDDVKSRLRGTADPLAGSTTNVSGQGALDVARALTATVPTVSQRSIVRSHGDGALGQERGGAGLAPGRSVDGPPGRMLDGDRTAQNLRFDGNAYVKGPWTGSSWYGSSWYGSSWYGSSWYGSSWYGSSWYGSSWYGSSWYGSSWYGSSWYGTSWYGTSWYGTSWYGASWYGASWYGTSWYGTSWYGASWYGASWYGEEWA